MNMRIIDADILERSLTEIDEHINMDIFTNEVRELIDNTPTVEAIPKAEVKKFLEEGAKNVSNNVLAIVREDYIHKSDYENRLKADMLAMLTELQLEIEEIQGKYSPYYDEASQYTSKIIQQKIDSLKGEKNET